jgi:hypothetical protein
MVKENKDERQTMVYKILQTVIIKNTNMHITEEE